MRRIHCLALVLGLGGLVAAAHAQKLPSAFFAFDNGTGRDLKVPLSSWNHGDLARSTVRASSLEGYAIMVACGFSVPKWTIAGLSHSGRTCANAAAASARERIAIRM